jgi:hypothetical protein
MTAAELGKKYGVSRQTIHAWIKSGRLVPSGDAIKNRRGRASRTLEISLARPSKKTPRWKRFEMMCLAGGFDPKVTMQLLLGKSRTDGFGDPDLFAAGLTMAMRTGRLFLNALNGDKASFQYVEQYVANLIADDRSAPELLPGKTFRECWKAAKLTVWQGLISGEWRYNVNPMNHVVNGCPRLIFTPRWLQRLDKPAKDAIFQKGWIHSTETGRDIGKEPAVGKVMLRLHHLLRDEQTKAPALAALAMFKRMDFSPDGWPVIDEGQKQAISWLADGDFKAAKRFAVAWAYRAQARVAIRPKWKLVNAIFGCSGNMPLPKPSRATSSAKCSECGARIPIAEVDENGDALCANCADD